MDAPVATLTGRFAGVEEVFGADGTALAAEIFACADAAGPSACWRPS